MATTVRLTLLFLGLFVLNAGPVLAASGVATPGGRLLVNDSDELTPGQSTTVTGSGFKVERGAPCYLYFDGATAGTCQAQSDEAIAGTITVPLGAVVGGHVAQACVGKQCDPTTYTTGNAFVTASVQVRVEGPPTVTLQPDEVVTAGMPVEVTGRDLARRLRGPVCYLYWDGSFAADCTYAPNGTLTQSLLAPLLAGPHELEACIADCNASQYSGSDGRLTGTARVTVIPVVQQISVPPLVGHTIRAATKTLAALGLTLAPTGNPTYIVIEQHPSAGQLVAPGTSVGVQVRPPAVRASPSPSPSTSASASPVAVGGTGLHLNGGGWLLLGGAAVLGLAGAQLRSSRRKVQREQARRWVHEHLGVQPTDDLRQDVRLDVLDRTPSTRVRLHAVADPFDTR